MAPRVRLVDVATRAGVSTATASLVLRDRPGPSAASREAVRVAAAELGYRPDRTASLLARRRTHLLGVVVDVGNAFQAELVTALDAAAGDRGLDLVLSPVTRRRSEREAAETLLDFRCEALVLLGPRLSSRALATISASCPTVAVGRAGTRGVTGVLASDARGTRMAVDHLVALGHERIAYLDGPHGSIAASRRRGYRQAMARHGPRLRCEVLPGGDTEAAGVGAARALLAIPGADRPTAVVCFNDRCAIGLRDELALCGVAVPGAVSVVGYDDSPLARLGTVDLTSVSQDPAALAEATVALVAGLLDGAGRGTPTADVVVDPRLVVRSSTAPPAGVGRRRDRQVVGKNVRTNS